MNNPSTHEEALAQLKVTKLEIAKLEKLSEKLEAQRDQIQDRLSTVLYAQEDRLEEYERRMRPVAHVGLVTAVVHHSWPSTSMGSGDGGQSDTFIAAFDSLEEAKVVLEKTHKTREYAWEASEHKKKVVGLEQHTGDGTYVYILFGDVRMNPPAYGFTQLKWPKP
jgi:hypothetical protein